jgi:hypothetical protein
MKVLLSEEQLKTLIKEDLGVSRASLAYANLIYQILEPKAIQFMESRNESQEKIILQLKDISRIYQSSMDDFIELPVEKIEIDFFCTKIPKGKKNIKFTSGGGFQPIDKKSFGGSYLKEPSLELPKYILEEITQTLVAKFSFYFKLSSEFSDEFKDKALYDLRDTIIHECNHLFESYKRAESGSKQFNVSLSWVGGKNYNVNREIFKIWQEFLDMIYYSEPYEINAKSQEAISQTSIMPFDEFKKTKFWVDSSVMKSFNADTFFEKLLNKIQEVNPEKTMSILNNLYKWFMTDYYKWMKVHGESPAKYIEKSNGLLDLIERFQPKINKAGDKLQRNYMRLYTLELEK